MIGGNKGRGVLIRNLSEGGMMVDGFAELRVGDRVEAELDGLGPVLGTVAWTMGERAGMAFDAPIDPALARVKPQAAPRPPFAVEVKADAKRPGFKTYARR